MSLVVPERSQPADCADPGESAASHNAIFGMVRAELIASIGHIRLPLSNLAKVQAGDLLPLQGQNLRGIEVCSITGERVASGRLGQVRGLRAVRLSDGTAPDPGTGSFAERSIARGPAPVANKGGLSRHAATQAPGSLSNTRDENDALPENLTADQAAEEISQLAGLAPDDGATPEAEEHN